MKPIRPAEGVRLPPGRDIVSTVSLAHFHSLRLFALAAGAELILRLLEAKFHKRAQLLRVGVE